MSDDWAWSVLGDANARAVQAVVRPMLDESLQEDAYGEWLAEPESQEWLPAQVPVYVGQDSAGPDWRTVLVLGALVAAVPMLLAVLILTRERSR